LISEAIQNHLFNSSGLPEEKRALAHQHQQDIKLRF